MPAYGIFVTCDKNFDPTNTDGLWINLAKARTEDDIYQAIDNVTAATGYPDFWQDYCIQQVSGLPESFLAQPGITDDPKLIANFMATVPSPRPRAKAKA